MRTTWRWLARARTALLGLALVGLLAGTATAQAASAAAPRTRDAACASLADVALAHQGVISSSAQVVAASGTLPAYCDVKLEERPAINIEVALPLNAADGGTGGSADGAWNAAVLDIGNGGYAGSIPPASSSYSVALALSRGDVGSATDNGHSPAASPAGPASRSCCPTGRTWAR